MKYPTVFEMTLNCARLTEKFRKDRKEKLCFLEIFFNSHHHLSQDKRRIKPQLKTMHNHFLKHDQRLQCSEITATSCLP